MTAEIAFPGADREPPAPGLRARRLAAVRAHLVAEMAGDVPATVATFPGGARYDIVPLGRAYDGDAAVRDLLTELTGAFGDLRLIPENVSHGPDAVIIEGRMTGTQRADWVGIACAGRVMDLRAAVFFHFDGDVMVDETVYYDHATAIAQLTGAAEVMAR